jgi:hypothetical protein
MDKIMFFKKNNNKKLDEMNFVGYSTATAKDLVKDPCATTGGIAVAPDLKPGSLSFESVKKTGLWTKSTIFDDFDDFVLDIEDSTLRQEDYIVHYRGKRILLVAVEDETRGQWIDRIIKVIEPKIEDRDKPVYLKQKAEERLQLIEVRISMLEGRLIEKLSKGKK